MRGKARLIDPDAQADAYALRRLGVRTQRQTDREVRHLEAYGSEPSSSGANTPPEVRGNRSANEALANLLQALDAAGLIVDRTEG